MEFLDTGKYSIAKVGDEYVHVTIYTDQELTAEETAIVLDYFSQFQGPVPILLHRRGRYSLSTDAQLSIARHARSLFNAFAFVDSTPLQKMITKIASFTYLKGLPVESFSSVEEARVWLGQFGGLPAFCDSRTTENRQRNNQAI